MRITKASYKIETEINGAEILKNIEKIGRTCYKSEDKITEESASRFVSMLIKRGHEAVIEHQSITVRFICDRGISHEIVRHRVASYAQESTRYCNYGNDKFGNELTFIEPCFWDDQDNTNYHNLWIYQCQEAEKTYLEMIENGAKPEEARSILPTSIKTELVVTMDLREWRHFFKLRTAKDSHPQMRELAIPLLEEFKKKLPVVFDDIGEE